MKKKCKIVTKKSGVNISLANKLSKLYFKYQKNVKKRKVLLARKLGVLAHF